MGEISLFTIRSSGISHGEAGLTSEGAVSKYSMLYKGWSRLTIRALTSLTSIILPFSSLPPLRPAVYACTDISCGKETIYTHTLIQCMDNQEHNEETKM